MGTGLAPPKAMASPVLFRRWQTLADRDLWLLLAALKAGYLLLVLSLLTQSPDQADQGSSRVASRIRSRAGGLIQEGKEGLEPGSIAV
jgi:hypothetical protein